MDAQLTAIWMRVVEGTGFAHGLMLDIVEALFLTEQREEALFPGTA